MSQVDLVPIATPPDTTGKERETERAESKDMLASRRHNTEGQLALTAGKMAECPWRQKQDRVREWICVCKRERVKASVYLLSFLSIFNLGRSFFTILYLREAHHKPITYQFKSLQLIGGGYPSRH